MLTQEIENYKPDAKLYFPDTLLQPGWTPVDLWDIETMCGLSSGVAKNSECEPGSRLLWLRLCHSVNSPEAATVSGSLAWSHFARSQFSTDDAKKRDPACARKQEKRQVH